MKTHMTKAFCTLLLLLAGAGATQAQSFGPPVGENAAVMSAKDSLAVSFQPAEWPHVQWSAGAGKSWDWRGHATLVFKAMNPGPAVIDFSVRIDDDPKADGVQHCHTAGASLGAGQSGTFFVDLAAPDPKATMGMKAQMTIPALPLEPENQFETSLVQRAIGFDMSSMHCDLATLAA